MALFKRRSLFVYVGQRALRAANASNVSCQSNKYNSKGKYRLLWRCGWPVAIVPPNSWLCLQRAHTHTSYSERDPWWLGEMTWTYMQCAGWPPCSRWCQTSSTPGTDRCQHPPLYSDGWCVSFLPRERNATLVGAGWRSRWASTCGCEHETNNGNDFIRRAKMPCSSSYLLLLFV